MEASRRDHLIVTTRLRGMVGVLTTLILLVMAAWQLAEGAMVVGGVLLFLALYRARVLVKQLAPEVIDDP